MEFQSGLVQDLEVSSLHRAPERDRDLPKSFQGSLDSYKGHPFLSFPYPIPVPLAARLRGLVSLTFPSHPPVLITAVHFVSTLLLSSVSTACFQNMWEIPGVQGSAFHLGLPEVTPKAHLSSEAGLPHQNGLPSSSPISPRQQARVSLTQ